MSDTKQGHPEAQHKSFSAVSGAPTGDETESTTHGAPHELAVRAQVEVAAGNEPGRAPPIVFLDMDDVLCLSNQFGSREMLKIIRQESPDRPELWAGLVDAEAAANLYELHMDFRPAFVVSSSWATYLDREQMCQALTRTNLQFVVDNLHAEWRTPRARSSSRRDEITWWLDEHRQPGQAFLVIDDSYSGIGLAHSPLALDGHVVLCRSGYGFTRKRLKEAKFQLLRQLCGRPFQVSTQAPSRASTGPEDDPGTQGSTAVLQRPKVSLSSLTSTEPRTSEDTRRTIAQGRIAELKPDQA